MSYLSRYTHTACTLRYSTQTLRYIHVLIIPYAVVHSGIGKYSRYTHTACTLSSLRHSLRFQLEQ
ncbi:hypothetical protein K439DRAFT_866750 [Ramaria rubella]|nr:hypothetical protein K439DRAFT_866750 [Ramaria rubella]